MFWGFDQLWRNVFQAFLMTVKQYTIKQIFFLFGIFSIFMKFTITYKLPKYLEQPSRHFDPPHTFNLRDNKFIA